MATNEAVWVQVTVPDDKLEELLKVPSRRRLAASLEGPLLTMPCHARHTVPTTPRAICRQVMETDCLESRKEEGCTRFDVLRDKANPSIFYFYETYVNADAAALHKTLPHYKLWADFKAANPSIGPTQSVIKAGSLFP